MLAGMAKIPPRLATELLAATGVACVRVVAVPGREDFSRVVSGGLELRKGPGKRIWLRARRQAERVMTDLFSGRRTSRRGHGLVIEASLAEVDCQIRASAALLGYTITEDERTDAQLAALAVRIEVVIADMQRKGLMKGLNREYAELKRTADQPPYEAWLMQRLRKGVAQALAAA
jgi:hypothetical protein